MKAIKRLFATSPSKLAGPLDYDKLYSKFKQEPAKIEQSLINIIQNNKIVSSSNITIFPFHKYDSIAISDIIKHIGKSNNSILALNIDPTDYTFFKREILKKSTALTRKSHAMKSYHHTLLM